MALDAFVISVKDAVIQSRRPNGSPWHVTSGDDSPAVAGAIVGLAFGSPEAGMAIGQAFSEKGGDPEAPIVYVALRIDGQEPWTTKPTGRTYVPAWNDSFIIPGIFFGDETVVIQVFDAVDNGLIGQTQMTYGDFVSKPFRTLTNFGSVASLDFEAMHAPPDNPDPSQQ